MCCLYGGPERSNTLQLKKKEHQQIEIFHWAPLFVNQMGRHVVLHSIVIDWILDKLPSLAVKLTQHHHPPAQAWWFLHMERSQTESLITHFWPKSKFKVNARHVTTWSSTVVFSLQQFKHEGLNLLKINVEMCLLHELWEVLMWDLIHQDAEANNSMNSQQRELLDFFACSVLVLKIQMFLQVLDTFQMKWPTNLEVK